MGNQIPYCILYKGSDTLHSCYAYHIGEFLQIHGGLLPFTQQGLEKYNDVMTKDYFRGSNNHSEQA